MGHVPRYLASLKREARYAVRIRGWHEPFRPAITTASRGGASKRHKAPLPVSMSTVFDVETWKIEHGI